jgi:hypothetical protein
MSVTADVGGRRHAVEEQRKIAVGLRDIEAVLARVYADVFRPAAVELGEQWTEPVLVLVVDGDGFILLFAHDFLLNFFVKKQKGRSM